MSSRGSKVWATQSPRHQGASSSRVCLAEQRYDREGKRIFQSLLQMAGGCSSAQVRSLDCNVLVVNEFWVRTSSEFILIVQHQPALPSMKAHGLRVKQCTNCHIHFHRDLLGAESGQLLSLGYNGRPILEAYQKLIITRRSDKA